MRYLFILVFVFSGCITKDVQTNSDNIFRNSRQVTTLSKTLKDLNPEKVPQAIVDTSIKNQQLAEEAMLKDKSILSDGMLSVIKKGVSYASGFLGIPPGVTEGVLTLGLGLLGVGGVAKVRGGIKKREKALAEANPEDAKKLL